MPKSVHEIIRDASPLPPPHETDIPRIAFSQVKERHCRWPCAEPEVAATPEPFFCGNVKIPGLSYCEVHARRAFCHAPPRRRERDFQPDPTTPAAAPVPEKEDHLIAA